MVIPPDCLSLLLVPLGMQIIKYHIVPGKVITYRELLDAGVGIHPTLSVDDR